MKPFDLVQGESDPISYTCSCKAGKEGGSVLLFYRYYSNSPNLPEEHLAKSAHPAELAAWHEKLTQKLNLAGKLRIAKEGFNITVAGTRTDIDAYVLECCAHWSFSGLHLDTKSARDEFFKPSDGCACVFSNVSSVRVAAEITPMGVEGYLPSDWSRIESLTPADFHERCLRGNNLLVDVRNHYESKIGYFVDPETGEPALRPAVRRFSQWPQFVKQNMQQALDENQGKPKQIMSYCTGGIRCEKAVRWMEENTLLADTTVTTLKGGIAAYLTWMKGEIEAGRKRPQDSLFKGRNYVFDARGSTGLTEESEPVSNCHLCGVPSDRLSKCHTKGCHLVLVACSGCETGELRCCQSCRDMEVDNTRTRQDRKGPKLICSCERERERELWGGDRVKTTKSRRSRKQKSDKIGAVDQTDISIKVVDKQ
ncbi:putative glucose transporter rco-3 [Venturia nashicola]|uniref:Putative glucose transporter rco-3 n=1 Tax=Venturia nashicola TaxID=86259 RepID=A0A4Z1P668_9PEZI|nr:putative glucose transporter rco-3 [Venturia nashicola]TLD36301.1 putative glucose transporter rco-3 [Venturia nashicola]